MIIWNFAISGLSSHHYITVLYIVVCRQPLLGYGTVNNLSANNDCTRKRGTRHVRGDVMQQCESCEKRCCLMVRCQARTAPWYHVTHTNREMVFSVGFTPRLYHLTDRVEFSEWSGAELRVLQLEASSGATVKQATASEAVKPWTRKLRDLRRWKPLPHNRWTHNRLRRLSRAVVHCRECELAIAL
jgi:hypothetical protein